MPAMTFDQALAHARAALDAITSDVERARRAGALEHFAAYVGLLHEATRQAETSAAPETRGYWLKLELEDGRWTVDYRPLSSPPEVGDTIELGRAKWLVRRLQPVTPVPPRVPRREFLVCRPAG